MAWVRVGDEALSHPKLMSLYDVEGAEGISIVEMFGFLMALATYSAKHLTDGIIERGSRGLGWTARRNYACSRMKSSFISSRARRSCVAAHGRGRIATRIKRLL